jgi:hypothetical protein
MEPAPLHAGAADEDHVHSGTPNGQKPGEPPRPPLEHLSVIGVYTFDPAKGEKGKIAYELLEPARMRVTVTAKDDPDQLYRVLFWDWQEAGEQVLLWDGMDQSGWPLDRKECAIRTRCIAKAVHRPGTRVIKALTTEQLVQGLQGPPDHSCCDPRFCRAMQVRFGAVAEQGNKERATKRELSPDMVLTRVAVIEAVVSQDARGYGDRTGFGVRWMVDQQLIAAQYYEKECGGKFTYALDTTAFEDGEHILRVSTCDHYDHIGVAGMKVVFNNK